MEAEIQALSKMEAKGRQPQHKQRKHFKNKMHLWEFLLELLHDKECRSLITWTQKERKEFRIIAPEGVAQLWGFEHNRKNMTHDKLSRALRQYYREGIIRKVKGQTLTYKFDELPYDYHPGITRRRKKASCAWKISSYPKHGMDRGHNIFHSDRNCQTNSSNADDGISSGDVPSRFLLSSQFSFLQPKTQIWFPEQARVSQSECGRRRANNWGMFASAAPESCNPSPPLLAKEQSAFGNVTPSLATYSGSFVTQQSSHSRSDLSVAKQNVSHEVSSSFIYAGTPESSRSIYPLTVMEQNASRNDAPSATMYAETFASMTPESSHSRSPLYVVKQNASRNDTPSAATYTETFASMTPESSHSRTPLYVVEKNASRNVLPSDLSYASVYVTDSVSWSTPVFPPIHGIPYLPLMYVVPVSCEHLPVITSVTGNYLGHPGNK